MNFKQVPTRKAVLICSPGSGKNRLPGVAQDLSNMYNYLLSPRGGAWYKSEIHVLDNPSAWQAWQATQVATDYSFVYFSGHGFMDVWGNNQLCLYDGDVTDTELLNTSVRQLVLIDACRVYMPSISGIPEEVEKWLYASGLSEARNLFNDYILSSPPGITIVHATAAGETAQDTPEGAIFTNALLNKAFTYKPTYGHYPVKIEDLIKDATQELTKSGSHQRPCIYKCNGSMQVPFAIASADFIEKKVAKDGFSISSQQKSPTFGNAAAVVGGLLFLAWLASK